MARATRDWKTLVAELATKMALTSVMASEIFAHRQLQADPHEVWQARIRVDADTAEKLICSSGLDACFVRPVLAKGIANHEQFTLVWVKRNVEATPTSVAEIIQLLEKLPGHRGLARSKTSIGVRVRWSQIKEARQLLTPADPRFVESTLSLQDGLNFKLEGIPAAATATEVARFTRELSWPAIPRRRVPFRGETTWWVSAATKPAQMYVKWAEHHILISQVSEEERYKGRPSNEKKKKEADKAKTDEGQPAASSTTTGADRLQEKDPWADCMSAGDRSTGSSSRPLNNVAKEQDGRLAALASRMDTIEQQHTALSEKVERVDNTVTDLSKDMKSQFQQVLAGIANLTALREQEEQEKKRRAGS